LNVTKLPRMAKSEIDALINQQIICRIAFGGKLAPYIAPFQYAFMQGHLYFHFTKYGRKMSLLEEGQPVCVEIEKYVPDLSEYSFIVLVGELQVVTDLEERAKAIAQMVENAHKKQLSPVFLQAHGLPKDADWSALTPDKPLIIVKLVKVTEIRGLKSP
jgi:uncharacterized protein